MLQKTGIKIDWVDSKQSGSNDEKLKYNFEERFKQNDNFKQFRFEWQKE